MFALFNDFCSCLCELILGKNISNLRSTLDPRNRISHFYFKNDIHCSENLASKLLLIVPNTYIPALFTNSNYLVNATLTPFLSKTVYFRCIENIDFNTSSLIEPIFVLLPSNISKSLPIVNTFYFATATTAPVEFCN